MSWSGLSRPSIYQQAQALVARWILGTSPRMTKGETRRVVALALSAALNAPIPEMRFGVFRM